MIRIWRANRMGIFTSRKKSVLKPKTEPGPESSLKEFPLLYLYFDDFSELQNVAKEGAFDIGMQRSFEGIGDYRFKEIFADEERFLDFYRNGMIRLRLYDGTTLDRKTEMRCWDRVVNPEKYVEEPEPQGEPPAGIHPRAKAELEAELQRLDKEINAEVEAIKRRYGM
jgi:hypothetical protein